MATTDIIPGRNGSPHGGRREGSGRPPGVPDVPIDVRERYAAARAEREEHEARLAELEVAEKEGELVSWALVKRDTQRAAMAYRDAVLSIGGRIAAQLAVMDDERAIERLITDAIRQELQRIADSGAQ